MPRWTIGSSRRAAEKPSRSTPFGLRSLAPDEPDFKPRYFGDLRARDAAYHQGTVWAWLIGPFIDAWLKVHPDIREKAGRFLAGFGTVVAEAGIGSISEIFDAEAPFTPRGCIAQAWSVAELLRAAAEDVFERATAEQPAPPAAHAQPSAGRAAFSQTFAGRRTWGAARLL